MRILSSLMAGLVLAGLLAFEPDTSFARGGGAAPILEGSMVDRVAAEECSTDTLGSGLMASIRGIHISTMEIMVYRIMASMTLLTMPTRTLTTMARRRILPPQVP